MHIIHKVLQVAQAELTHALSLQVLSWFLNTKKKETHYHPYSSTKMAVKYKVCTLILLLGIAVAVSAGYSGSGVYNPNKKFGDFTPKQKAEKIRDEQSKAKEAGKKCAKEGGNNAAKMACMLREGKKSIASAGGRNLTDVEVLEKIKEGAMQQAAEAVKNCTRDATTKTAKRNCKTGTLAKSKCKEANGGKECSDVDLVQGVKNQVTKDLRDLMETCVSSKTTNTDKENCRKSKTKDFKNNNRVVMV